MERKLRDVEQIDSKDSKDILELSDEGVDVNDFIEEDVGIDSNQT